jgi:hypothetical protein
MWVYLALRGGVDSMGVDLRLRDGIGCVSSFLCMCLSSDCIGMGCDGMGWDGMGCDIIIWDEIG